MKIAYLNCSSGISGDMFLSSFINAGTDAVLLERELKKKLGVQNWRFKLEQTKSFHIMPCTLRVEGVIRFSSPKQMGNIIRKSKLSQKTKTSALKIFNTLLSAEAKVHGIKRHSVHFHELNSIDTLIDITGAAYLIEREGIKKIYSSAVNLGKGAPATLEIIRRFNIPVFSENSKFELTTPTGAAIISNVACDFSSMPMMKVSKYGFGCGTKKILKNKSVLSVLIGELEAKPAVFPYISSDMVKIETNIDDMDPRIYPYVMEKLLKSGANDVWLRQVIMKKGRPGIVFSVICKNDNSAKMMDIIFNETTTLGVRVYPFTRYELKREQRKDKKIAYLKSGTKKVKAEFKFAVQKARKTSLPLKKVIY